MRTWLTLLIVGGVFGAVALVVRKAGAREDRQRGSEPGAPPDAAAKLETRVRATLLAGGVDNFDLSVEPGRRTITVGAYGDPAQVQAALAPLRDGHGLIDGYAVHLAGPTGGGGGVMSRMDAIRKLQQDLEAEKNRTPVDEDKVRRLEQTLAELAQAELDARQAAKTAPPASGATAGADHPEPLYPVGTRATFGGYTGTILQAWWDVGRWNYSVRIDGIPVFGSTEVVRGEEELKRELAQRMGATPGPAYPAGLQLARRGRRGVIEEVRGDGAGSYVYRLQGADAPIGERSLADLLGSA